MEAKKRIQAVHVTILFIASFFSSKACAVASNSDALSARRSALKDLMNSTAGAASEPARIFRTPDGYVRFLSAAPGTRFLAVSVTAEERAAAFLATWRNLFVNESDGVALEQKHVKTANGRTYIRYSQT